MSGQPRLGGAEAGDVQRALRDWFGPYGLPEPYIPTFARDKLQVQPPKTLTTEPVVTLDLFMFNPAAKALLAGSAHPRFCVSYSGHGANSYAWTVLLLRPGLRLLTQSHFGGAYSRAARDADGVAEMFALVAAIDRVVPSGTTEEIVVLDSRMRGMRHTGRLPAPDVPFLDWRRAASELPPLLAIRVIL